MWLPSGHANSSTNIPSCNNCFTASHLGAMPTSATSPPFKLPKLKPLEYLPVILIALRRKHSYTCQKTPYFVDNKFRFELGMSLFKQMNNSVPLFTILRSCIVSTNLAKFGHDSNFILPSLLQWQTNDRLPLNRSLELHTTSNRNLSVSRAKPQWCNGY